MLQLVEKKLSLDGLKKKSCNQLSKEELTGEGRESQAKTQAPV